MMNIVLITDENYVTPSGTAIASILRSNFGEQFTFYIVTRRLSENHIEELERFIEPSKKVADLRIVTIGEDDLIDFPLRAGDHVSVATYYRIYFPKILPQSLDKVLFLDGDILCVDSLREFYDTDCSGYSCVVTHDERNDEAEIFRRLNYPKENGYFCAGVMLINLDWWRKNDVMQKCLDYISREPDSCLWHDQDALNHVLNGTVLWAPFRYNYMQGYFFSKNSLNIDKKFYDEIDRDRQNPCLLHFSSAYKPWHKECNHPLKKQYREFYRKYTGKTLPLTHKLHGIRRVIWYMKKILNFWSIRTFADFRKPLVIEKNRYQFFEFCPNQKIAGSKAPQDVQFFAENLGFKTLYFFHWGERGIFHRITGQIRRFFEYFFFFFRIKRNSILFLQFPYIRGGIVWRRLFLTLIKKCKSVKIITLIHDINELRYEHAETEVVLLDYAIHFSDLLIAHNENMSDYLVTVRHVPEKKVFRLGVFDYYAPAPNSEYHFEHCISIAGNLDQNKCLYLNKLPELKNITFHLYGMNYNNNNNNNNIVYHGVFEPDLLVQELTHGFGLVWDGDSDETCNGLYGKYLMFNNPHKLSMYLCAGLPVLVWEKSALRDFVVSNRIGIAISSLKDAVEKVNGMNESDYLVMHENCLKFSALLRRGHYLKTALRKGIMELEG